MPEAHLLACHSGNHKQHSRSPARRHLPVGSLSAVHSYSTVDGFEANVSGSILLYGYRGGIDIAKNAVLDSNGDPSGNVPAAARFRSSFSIPT